MGAGYEMIVVAVIVGVAAVWAVIAARRSLQRKGGCSTCGDTGSCPLVADPEAEAKPSGPCGLQAEEQHQES